METEVHGACLCGGIRKMIANGIDVNDGRTLHLKISGRRSVRGARAERECNGSNSRRFASNRGSRIGFARCLSGWRILGEFVVERLPRLGCQTFGMWQNSSAPKDFTPSRNNLALSRTLLQVDENS